jgi:hypothetical protein
VVGQIGYVAVAVDAAAAATADKEAAEAFICCEGSRLAPTFGEFRGGDVDPGSCAVHLTISPPVFLIAMMQSYQYSDPLPG